MNRSSYSQLAAVLLAGLFLVMMLPAMAGELDPVATRQPLGESGPKIGRFSDRTLVVGIEIDRDQSRMVAFTVKNRPYERSLDAREPRAYALGEAIQVEVVMNGPAGRTFTQQVDAGSICFDHPAGTEDHIAGDTILVHRDSFLVELPDISGFNLLSVAYYQGGIQASNRRLIGTDTLDAAHFTPAAGGGVYVELALADQADTSSPADSQGSNIEWPEDHGDTDIYHIYGDEATGGERVNITILADGYTYAQKSLIKSHADTMVDYFRTRSPFREHDPFTNYTLVYAYSVDSGTDQCDCDIISDTAFGTGFPTGNEICGHSDNRCLYYGRSDCDSPGTNNILQAELRAPYPGSTIIMVNVNRWGGCGGARAVYAAAVGGAHTIALHEMGHSLAGLADEYSYTDACGSSAGETNTSMNATTGAWPEWIDELGAPWEGGQYYQQCIYRPEFTCAMRDSGPFCSVCNQVWALETFGDSRIINTAPIRSATPSSPAFVHAGVPLQFNVQTRLSAGTFARNEVTWVMEGPGFDDPTVVGTDPNALTYTWPGIGQYTLTLTIIADTNFIQPEKFGPNVDVVVWDVAVGCPADPDPGEPDTDLDGFLDICDNCPLNGNAGQLDTDLDGVGDACDVCPFDALNDTDDDTHCDDVDNCPLIVNTDQLNADGDAYGDVCDSCINDALNDGDADSLCADVDNCPLLFNPAQLDGDGDSLGNGCDACPDDPFNDADLDGVCGDVDNCSGLANPGQEESEEGYVVEMSQWAVLATATSELSTTFHSAMQATGVPETPFSCVSVNTTWRPLRGTNDTEILELTYATPVKATGVTVHESQIGHFVTQIDLVDIYGGVITVWAGSDATNCGGTFSPTWPTTAAAITSVRVHTSTFGWEEIDAVELHGYEYGPNPDGVGDACDNCIYAVNASQFDTDGDDAGDACDCAPSDAGISIPFDVSDLMVARSGAAGESTLTWAASPGVSSYALTRGDLSVLSAVQFGSCLTSGITSTSTDDSESPASGGGYCYLIQAETGACGSLGESTTGTRDNQDSGACIP